jgi:uncharacterized protein YecE (DUF72 family)
MQVLRGTVVSGKVVVDGAPLEEGARVTVLVPEKERPFSEGARARPRLLVEEAEIQAIWAGRVAAEPAPPGRVRINRSARRASGAREQTPMRKLTSARALCVQGVATFTRGSQDAKMLDYYGEHFQVEINNTFYRMPRETVLRDWAGRVPADFRFVLKASREITHYKRLKEKQPVEYLVAKSAALGEKRGPILFQLPPNLKQDLERLKTFLSWIPDGTRAALEFRHESWHDEAVFAALREHNAALSRTRTQSRRARDAFVATADWAYLRLRKESYDPGELEEWAACIGKPAWGDVFVFFKHEDEGAGPRLAKQFEAIAARP